MANGDVGDRPRDENGKFVTISNWEIYQELKRLGNLVDQVLVHKAENLEGTTKDHESRIRKLEIRLPSIIAACAVGVAIVLKISGVI